MSEFTPLDPIHEENGQWYFWDEVWCDRLGPYPDRATATSELKRYCEFLDKGPTNVQ